MKSILYMAGDASTERLRKERVAELEGKPKRRRTQRGRRRSSTAAPAAAAKVDSGVFAKMRQEAHQSALQGVPRDAAALEAALVPSRPESTKLRSATPGRAAMLAAGGGEGFTAIVP